MEIFARRLKGLRKEKKLSQKKLGSLLCKTGTCIANWESGLHEPSLVDIIKLRYIFNVSVDYLIGLID